MVMMLYEHPLSSCVQKVKIALRKKRLVFDTMLPNDFGIGRVEGTLAGVNPSAGVPTMIDGNTILFECSVILAYVEESQPETPLLPVFPAERAPARLTVCDTEYEAVKWGLVECSGSDARPVR